MMRSAVIPAIALLASGCPGTTGPTVDPGLYNLDQQIDGLSGIADAAEVESFDARMCVAGSGRIYVVWYDDRDGFSDVWLNRSDDEGETFLPQPVRVKQGPGNASGVDLDCAGDRVYVVWEDDRDGETGYQNIYLNFSTDGGDTWLAEDKAIDNDPDGIAISLGPQISIFEGRVHVAWYDQIEGAPDIYMASSINGGRKFDPPVRISGNREEGGAGEAWSGNPKMSLDSTGRIYVVWEDTRNGLQDIFFASSNNGGQGFNPQKRIDTGDERGSHYSFSPQIGVSDTSTYVVWHDSRAGDGRDIFMNYSSDGGDVWLDDATRVETDGMGFFESINPDLVVLGDAAHIVWQDKRNVGYDIFYRRADGGVFDATEAGAELRIDSDAPGNGNSAGPRIVSDGTTLLVAWSDYRDDPGDGYNDLYYNFTSMEGEELEFVEDDLRIDSIAPGTSFTESLQITLHEGQLFSAWVDGRNGSRDIYFSRVLLGEEVDSLFDFIEAGGEL